MPGSRLRRQQVELIDDEPARLPRERLGILLELVLDRTNRLVGRRALELGACIDDVQQQARALEVL
jgi:hypothetical protein